MKDQQKDDQQKVSLIFYSEEEGKRKMIDKWSIEIGKKYTIGRSKKKVDISIQDIITISRIQCEIIFYDKDKIMIKDFNSSNGTYINKERIEPNKERYFSIKDMIISLTNIIIEMKEIIDMKDIINIIAEKINMIKMINIKINQKNIQDLAPIQIPEKIQMIKIILIQDIEGTIQNQKKGDIIINIHILQEIIHQIKTEKKIKMKMKMKKINIKTYHLI